MTQTLTEDRVLQSGISFLIDVIIESSNQVIVVLTRLGDEMWY